MNQIELDFQKLRYASVWRLIGIFLFIVTIVLSSMLIIKNQQNIDEANKLLVEIEHLKHPVKVATKPKDEAEYEALKNQLKEADVVIKRLNQSWPSLLKALEDTREKDVDLLSVTPNAQSGEVLIVGQAESIQVAFAYIERLKKSQEFSKVELNNHQKIMHSGVQALRFNITAKWLPHHE